MKTRQPPGSLFPPRAASSNSSACAMPPVSLLRWKPATAAPRNSPGFWTHPSAGNLSLESLNAITRSNSATPTKRLTRPRPTRESRRFSPFLAAIPCCAFARSSIPLKAKRSCMSWATIAPTGTISSFAGSAKADGFLSRPHNCFRWWVNIVQRGYCMLVILKRNDEEISLQAAQLIATAVHKKPALVLGLATGSTMVGVYKHLVGLHKQGSLDFSRVVTFNLDEYLGLPAAHPQSFHHFMHENLFAHVNVLPRNIHIPDGTIRGNYDQYCASYEQAIRKAGGIDIQLLGIGRNGHIGFNEPTSSIGSRTRLKVLSQETLDDNSKFFAPGEESPRCAITMGIGTILEARKVLLLATGASKSQAIAKSIEGPITSAVSASALQLHPDVTFIVDDAAASQLTQRDYYHRVLEMTALLTPDRLS